MSKTKSVVIRMDIDQAKISHNCQSSKQHRINKGDTRLKVRTKTNRGWDHYCAICAEKMLETGIQRLEELKSRFL